jgi:hypothetical protein
LLGWLNFKGTGHPSFSSLIGSTGVASSKAISGSFPIWGPPGIIDFNSFYIIGSSIRNLTYHPFFFWCLFSVFSPSKKPSS